jgi:hypothetical protein
MRRGVPVATLLLIALGLRLAVLTVTWGRVAWGDPGVYLTIARNVLAGHGLTVSGVVYGVAEQKAFYPPLYPLLLAAVGLVAPLSQVTILVLNFALDCATAYVIVKLAKRLGFPPLLAAAIYLLCPSNVLLAPLPQKEGLTSLLVALSAWFAIQRSAPKLGVVTGLLALTQPALAPLPFIFSLLIKTPRLFITAATATLVMIPWWIRNYAVFGTFVPLTTGGGYGLWIGTFNNDGWWVPPPQRLLTGGELSFSKAASHEAWDWIVSHPAQFIWHSVAKIGRGLVNGWWPIDNLMRMQPTNAGVLKLLPYSIGLTSILTALGIFGGTIVRRAIGRLLLACLIQLLVFNLWFEFSERHTYFVMPFLSLAVAAGVQQVWRDLRIGDRGRGEAGSPECDVGNFHPTNVSRNVAPSRAERICSDI